MKRFDGAIWKSPNVQRYNGANWIKAIAKRFDGSNWVQLNNETKKVTLVTTWTQVYNQNNAKITFENSNRLCQGNYTTGYGYQGIHRNLVGFDTSSLIGKSIKSVRVYVYSTHWWYNAGGTLFLGYHGHSAKPNTFSHLAYAKKTQNYTTRVQGQWITMPSDFAKGIGTGAIRGFSIFNNDNTLARYGKFNGFGMANAPKMEVTYED